MLDCQVILGGAASPLRSSLRGMGFSDKDVARVRDATNVLEVISEHAELRLVGRRLHGLCPFHNDKIASLAVNATDEIFYCFGCQARGDVFDFVQQQERVDFPTAVRLLAMRANIALDEDEK